MGVKLMVAGLLWLSFTVAAVTEVTLYGDDSYPPYSYLEDGEARGIYVDLLRQVVANMPDYQVRFVAQPWRRILSKVEHGEYFAFYPPYAHPQLRPYIDPYSLPLLQEQISVICQAKFRPQQRHNFPLDFYGLTFANNAGFSVGGQAFLQAVQRGDIHIEEAKSTEQNLRKLLTGRVDCYVNDRISILSTLEKLQSSDVAVNAIALSEGPVVSSQWAYLGFSRQADNFPFKDDFIVKFNQQLQLLQQSGAFAHYLRQVQPCLSRSIMHYQHGCNSQP